MTRLKGPDNSDLLSYTIGNSGNLKSLAGETVVFYNDLNPAIAPLQSWANDGNRADILTEAGDPIVNSQIELSTASKYTTIQFPDGTPLGPDSLIVSVNGGPVQRVYAREKDQIDAAETRLTALEAGGAGDALLLHRAGAEAISGVKTFNVSPVVPTPTTSTQAASKGYADALVDDLSGVTNAAAARAVLGVSTSSALNMADSGADLTGATFSDTAIDDMLATAGTSGTVHFPAGTYKRSTTMVLNCNVTMSPAAIINYTGSGVAVQIGTDTSGVFFQYKVFELGRINYANKPATGWVAGTVGLKVINAYRSFVDFIRITGFETNYLLYGKGFGVSYVTTRMGHLDNGKINQLLDKDLTGWCNQCTFLGGSFSHNSGEGQNVAGTRHIKLAHSTGNADPNQNCWVNPGVESPGVVEYVLDINGSYNKWINPRFEFTGGYAKVLWGEFAFHNQVDWGYDTSQIIEEVVPGGFGNSIVGSNGSRRQTSSTSGDVIENAGSNTSAFFTGMRAGAFTLGDDKDTNYTWRPSSNKTQMKRYNDTADRVVLDGTTGKIQLGDGTTLTTQWSEGLGSPEGVVTAGPGSLYSRRNGSAGTSLYVKETGTGNTGWVAYSSGGAPPDVQTFTSSGTWTKPAGAVAVEVTLIGGGAGGGSGRKGLDGTVRCGGGGGSGGALTKITIPAASLPSSVAVTVGTGGAGGAAQTTDSTNGNPGNAGGTTTFAGFIRALGGVAGSGGTATAGTGGSSSAGTSPSGAGASASATGGVPTGPATNAGPLGGAAGGGITAANAASNGGAANSTGATWGTTTSGSGGVVDTTAPTNGNSAPVGTTIPGSAGGGGAASVTTNAQAGANGGLYGTGGSGGGAAKDATGNSGAGGAGADGIAQIVTYF